MATGIIDFSRTGINEGIGSWPPGVERNPTLTQESFLVEQDNYWSATSEGLLVDWTSDLAGNSWPHLAFEGSHTTGTIEALFCVTQIQDQVANFGNTGTALTLRKTEASFAGYYCAWSSASFNTLAPYRQDEPSGQTALGTVTGSLDSMTNKRLMRVQHDGTTFRGRSWKYGESEPSAWDFEHADATYTEGGAGMYLQGYGGTFIYHWASWGSDGDSAPFFGTGPEVSVSGDLKLPDGNPARGYKVFAYDRVSGQLRDSTITDSTGKYYLHHVRSLDEVFVVAQDQLGDTWNAVVKDLIVPSSGLLPAVEGWATGYSSISTTSYTFAYLPTGRNVGDLLVMAVATGGDSYFDIPTGWQYAGIAIAQNSGNSSTLSVVRIIWRVCDGTEPNALTLTNATSCTWETLCCNIKVGTYTKPRGSMGLHPEYSTVGSENDPSDNLGIISCNYVSTGTSRYHASDFAPAYGDEACTVLDFLLIFGGTSVTSIKTLRDAGRLSFVHTSSSTPHLFSSSEPIKKGQLPLPYNLVDPDSQGTATARMVMCIRGIQPPSRPELYHLFRKTHGSTAVTETVIDNVNTVGDRLRRETGDLDIIVIAYYGGSGVTVTPPTGYTQVAKYGSKFVIFSRLIDGTESGDDLTFTYSSAMKPIAFNFLLSAGSFDPSGEIQVAGATLTAATTITAPDVTLDSSWDNKANMVVRFVAREGIGGTDGRTIENYPSDHEEYRGSGFNVGSSNDAVSYAHAAKVVDGSTVGTADFVFQTGYAAEAITLAIKGI